MRLRKFTELADRVRADRERSLRVDAHKDEVLREVSLAEMRAARQRTQAEVARVLQTTQSGVSRLEHQTDLYVSTLRSYVEALGGRLEIYGVFPDVRVPITSFSDADEAGEEVRSEAWPRSDPLARGKAPHSFADRP